MMVNKQVFHCAVCGHVVHVYSESDPDQAICCGKPMNSAFKEALVVSARSTRNHPLVGESASEKQ